jgi:transposase InsO family protein
LYAQVGPVRQRKRKRQRLGESTVPAKRLRAERPNRVWALDFQFDTTSHGRTLKLLNVVDEYTREALAMRVARWIDADQKTRVLDQIARERGAGPELVRMDSGPEMTANALRDWCRFSGGRAQLHRAGLAVAAVRGVVRLPRPRRGALGGGVRLGDRGANGHK